MTDRSSGVLLVVAAALIDAGGRVLVQRRPAGTAMAGLWEFPGGKLEQGETLEAALVRELREELGVTVATGHCEPLAFATGAAGGRPLLLLLFAVRRWLGEPRALHASALRWVTPAELGALPMPPADVPLVAALARALP
jgi:8-oxo-dGTP diphosphatase